ncbi:5-demethoxyubiquinol-8 5-hydroxylase UbiM [Snodgrassella sp. B3882]|uniref:5-demethoxyubiquinol-8 5-hydroxylase UbiM n=1 Tax=Snodgrassella sp. B3882 TaxID=2818037 RepID=UPI00226A5A44|nr:5-demethoxyubiquinol-8 5-hydroxylase UbiM [Snodgrassella sp. B3882]MCX8745034.1 5-demethoxyubiquinol-8 5-hydroxylase UbiM [Snodgrassella sp. B3882]
MTTHNEPARFIEQADVVIVGAGPAGLSMARALAPSGLAITIVEKNDRATLAEPPFDGREIALTHYSKELMQKLQLWSKISPEEIYPLRDAKVINGHSNYQLHFEQPTKARGKPANSLGFLISNHNIRRAAYEAVLPYENIQIIDGHSITEVNNSQPETIEAVLDNGQILKSKLLIAADSRFSGIRRQLGIGANMRDFGRTVIVFRMRHTLTNQHTAFECFHYGRTLALLPLEENLTNCVITINNEYVKEILSMTPTQLEEDIKKQLRGKLGDMTLASTIHHYPLVGVHANTFYTHRAALIGDAAVGMHPVTAHGFNLGLNSVGILAKKINDAVQQGKDIGSSALLASYQRHHMPHTLALYHGTNAMISLFTNDTPPARLVRSMVLRVSNNLPPLKKLISLQLTG